MKIIHCADLHLDSGIETLPADKGKLRREEIVRTFERLCEYAAKESVKAVILAGDIFDTSKVTKKTESKVLTAIRNCRNTDFLYLSGNHDEDVLLKAEAESLPENFKVFGKEWTVFDYGEAVISGVSLNKINAKFVYDSLKTDKSRINIVCMHGQVYGYNNTSEDAEAISLPRLKDKNIDYLALGHIHSYVRERLDDRGIYVYSGCLDGRGFDETGVKGFSLIEIKDGKISDKFVPFCSRVFYSAEYSVENAEGSFYKFADGIINDLKTKCDGGDLIKVVLTGKRSGFETDKEDLARKLNEIFFFAKVYDKTTLKISSEDYAADKSVRGEFVRLVLASDLTEEEKTAVLEKGFNALRGEL